jgi:hypothetical protein
LFSAEGEWSLKFLLALNLSNLIAVLLKSLR